MSEIYELPFVRNGIDSPARQRRFALSQEQHLIGDMAAVVLTDETGTESWHLVAPDWLANLKRGGSLQFELPGHEREGYIGDDWQRKVYEVIGWPTADERHRMRAVQRRRLRRISREP